MTKKDMFEFIKQEMAGNAEVVAFCEKEIEMLSRQRKPRVNMEAIEFSRAVMTYLCEQEEPVTAKEIADGMGESVQKVNAAIIRLEKEEEPMVIRHLVAGARNPDKFSV